jgi:hypothetical protein
MLCAMRTLQKLILPAILLFAAILFLTGIDWGLPSHQADAFLFGNRQPWTGKQIMDLAGDWDTGTSRGADVAMHPLARRDQPLVVNDTDAKRAEIVRRYRLYSAQPDEMITFRSLSRMKPAKLNFDPALYQYGGLWIYPVGGLLKLAAMFHLVTLHTDLAFYLDHPEAFARFYLVARAYSVLWGLIGVAVVYALGKEFSGKVLVAMAAAMIYACMPVVIDLAHEAKPHLAGTVLTLMTVLAAMRYVRSGLRKWWILSGIFAGASMGMVLTGYVAFAVLPVMTMLRPMCWKTRARITGAAMLIGIAVFAITNPYVPFNLIFHRQLLHSNIGNSVDIYSPGISISGLINSAKLIMEGTSPGLLIIGLTGVAFLSTAERKKSLLAVAVAGLVLLQFILLARGKPAEYARFALAVDVFLALAAAALVGHLPVTPREKALAAMLAVAGTLYFGLRYDINFFADTRPNSTRMESAQTLARNSSRSKLLYVYAEPAPYCLPPVDLFDWQIVLLPRGSDIASHGPGTTTVIAVDTPRDFDPLSPPRVVSPISWANKPFEIRSGPPR